MIISTKVLVRLALLAGGLSIASTAGAVGDPPKQLGRREAIAAYANVLSLLTNDGVTCPSAQRPVSGTITGGAAPAGGSQTTTLQFDKGGVVTIARRWSRMPGEKPSSSVEVSCK